MSNELESHLLRSWSSVLQCMIALPLKERLAMCNHLIDLLQDLKTHQKKELQHGPQPTKNA